MKKFVKILDQQASAIYREKNSRFIAFVFPVFTEEMARQRHEEIKKSHHDADHFPYGYILGLNKEIQRSSDDGEPSGTAGKPILNELLSFDVTYTMLVVVRYFGGTKLGTSGLKEAFKTAAHLSLQNAKIVEKQPARKLIVTVPYEHQHLVYTYASKNHFSIEESQSNKTNVKFSIMVPLSLVELAQNSLSMLGTCLQDDDLFFI
jgi:uncharacterized YigZ family protein